MRLFTALRHGQTKGVRAQEMVGKDHIPTSTDIGIKLNSTDDEWKKLIQTLILFGLIEKDKAGKRRRQLFGF
jgi:hypothetical protein